ncbi:hypothetical protein GMST_40370 [Geomonas silvestris]|uniref:YtkA-like domain-containing protein n=1 Tax=Geomonas silvestris TaxID=2740184 RepID=A0A6V8MP72_9BACT|nr:hypothetical protein [Geomonas silvestris]GFO61712.1 hypothetical protein GMST_40370 [Geomonas silvestris]
MKKLALVLAASCLALSAPALAAMDHGGMDMDHSSHGSGMAHEEVVEGVKVGFKIQSAKEAMKAMKMEMPMQKGETHYIATIFKDAKTGKALTEGEVKVKVMAPDKSEQTKDLMAMHGEFGAFFDLSKKGKYGIMTKFQLKDGKTRSAKFWYTVK